MLNRERIRAQTRGPLTVSSFRSALSSTRRCPVGLFPWGEEGRTVLAEPAMESDTLDIFT